MITKRSPFYFVSFICVSHRSRALRKDPDPYRFSLASGPGTVNSESPRIPRLYFSAA